MRNAKQEFLEHIYMGLIDHVKCVYINVSGKKFKTIFLRKDFSQKSWNEFLDYLDFDYDEKSLKVEIEGTIWYNDNTWSTHDYIDYEQVWVYHKMPQPPKFLV